ncbi:MAG: glycosyl transferase, partial [Ferrovibrio sp.]
MIAAFRSLFDIYGPSSPWHDTAPVREELFGLERLEEHAASLASAQRITATPPAVLSLRTRLDRNAAVLLAAYRSNAAALEGGGSVAPAAEWLLDNYHIVEEQIREIRDDLPPGYYRQLPKLAEGPFAGYPRVFGMAWAFVAHTDSHFDPEILRRFIVAYQRIQPLTIGELWAIAITLRIVLVENLRRLADQITTGQRVRAEADALADRLLAPGNSRSAFDTELAGHSSSPLSERFAAQLAKRLRDQDPRTMPALGWLERQLRNQNLTIGEVVDHAQQRQGASNVTVRNVITSMRLISNIDWAELVESVSLVDERLRRSSDFAAMDFTTRDLYRKAVEQLARHSSHSELAVVDHTLMAVQRSVTDPADVARIEQMADPGYHLIGDGRPALERIVGFRPPVRLWINRFSIRLGLPGYAGAILLTTLVLLGFAVSVMASYGLSAGWLAAFAALGFIPATEVAGTLVNRAVTWTFGAIVLPGLELKTGVPASLRTLVVVPTLLTNESDLLEQIERLEIHYLSGAGGDLSFALLSDGVDADEGMLESDAHLLATAVAAIAALNHKHGPGPSGNRFHFLHRRRVFNAGESKWMGWERKRGKLDELNRLLRGATDTTFMTTAGCAPQLPDNIRYVITLDADTRLPRDAALRLIGKMAHPLNRPTFDAAGQRVVSGYGILQPRVTPSLPVGRDGSLYQRIFSSPGGIDPYAAAVSDVYQDLFGEGSYTGKGIYDVDAFHAALAGRVPENTVLSHDLFEGVFARAGLVSDIEVIEDFPSRYDVIANRQHRWTRGDWQLVPWIFGTRRRPSGLTGIGRWKMLDNLRRSLLAPLTVLLIGLCGLLPLQAGLAGLGFVLAAMAVPAFLPVAFALLPHRSGTRLRSHIGAAASDLRDATLRILLSVAFLADQAWRMIDAIGRTLVRLLVTRRHLLEWTTAAEAAGRPRLTLRGFYRRMSGGLVLSLIFGGSAL